jgi:hypothetical protein
MKKTILFALLISLLACSVQEKIIVTNVHDLASYPPDTYLYALPRTRLAFTIQAVRHTTIPGPYAEYSKKYLGIEGVPRLSFTSWEITGIEMKEMQEPDPDYYYALQTRKASATEDILEKLYHNGHILNTCDFLSMQQFSDNHSEGPGTIYFTDRSVKHFYRTDSLRPKRDLQKKNTPVDLPVSKLQKPNSSEQVKAEEAANFIIKTRKRRFKLLSGQYTVFPEGQALETSIRELNRLEEEYLSLFIGKTYSDTSMLTCYFIPGFGQEIERKELCRFSEKTGFLDAANNAGIPVQVDIRNLKYTASLKEVQLPGTGNVHKNAILYRVPDKASVRIIYGSSTVLDAEVKVYQYGAVVPYSLPVK